MLFADFRGHFLRNPERTEAGATGWELRWEKWVRDELSQPRKSPGFLTRANGRFQHRSVATLTGDLDRMIAAEQGWPLAEVHRIYDTNTIEGETA